MNMSNYYDERKNQRSYQELEEFHGPDLNTLTGSPRCNNDDSLHRSMELNSTVIVSDGKFLIIIEKLLFISINTCEFYRYIHCRTGD